MWYTRFLQASVLLSFVSLSISSQSSNLSDFFNNDFDRNNSRNNVRNRANTNNTVTPNNSVTPPKPQPTPGVIFVDEDSTPYTVTTPDPSVDPSIRVVEPILSPNVIRGSKHVSPPQVRALVPEKYSAEPTQLKFDKAPNVAAKPPQKSPDIAVTHPQASPDISATNEGKPPQPLQKQPNVNAKKNEVPDSLVVVPGVDPSSENKKDTIPGALVAMPRVKPELETTAEEPTTLKQAQKKPNDLEFIDNKKDIPIPDAPVALPQNNVAKKATPHPSLPPKNLKVSWTVSATRNRYPVAKKPFRKDITEKTEKPVKKNNATYTPQKNTVRKSGSILIKSNLSGTFIQVASYTKDDIAKDVAKKNISNNIIQSNKAFIYKPPHSKYYKLVVGPFTKDDVGVNLLKLNRHGFSDAFVLNL